MFKPLTKIVYLLIQMLNEDLIFLLVYWTRILKKMDYFMLENGKGKGENGYMSQNYQKSRSNERTKLVVFVTQVYYKIIDFL